MSSATHTTQSEGGDQPEDSNEWQNVVTHAKAMQQAIERYTGNYSKIQGGNGLTNSANQLNKSGNAFLTFANAIAETVDPLIQSLSSETPSDALSETSKVLNLFDKIAAEQDAAILALSKSLSEIVTDSNSDGNVNVEPTTIPAVPVSSLPPDVQAIKDSFDKMMGGKIDPRMGFGKIPPPQFQQNKET